jgi:hypothetical protein
MPRIQFDLYAAQSYNSLAAFLRKRGEIFKGGTSRSVKAYDPLWEERTLQGSRRKKAAEG